VVVECMALDPELQWVSERQMVRASLGVITNVRRDHEEGMGGELDSIASALANSIPRRAVLVCGDGRHTALFAARAARVGTRVVPVPVEVRRDGPTSPGAWLDEDRAIALAVARELGLDDETARHGFDTAPLDPGAASSGALDLHDGRLHWLDATAANDPESLARLVSETWGEAPGTSGWASRLAVVYNHRADRGRRLLDFARARFGREKAGMVWVTGDRPPWFLWRTIRRIHGAGLRYVAPSGLRSGLAGCPGTASSFVLSGNTRGLNLRQVLGQVNHG